MREYSYVETERVYNNIGLLEKQTYQIIGESPYFRFDFWTFKNLGLDHPPKEFSLDQYKFVFVENEPFSPSCIYTIKKGFWWARVLHSPILKIFNLIYRRVIITLAVWNLADYHQAELPSWRDIKLFKRIN